MKKLIPLLCFSFLLLAFVKQGDHEVIFSKEAPSPIGPYSQAIKAGGVVYVSGQIALKPDGSLDSSTIENECKQVLDNIQSILKAASLKMSDIHKSTIYCTDLKNFAKINKVYQSYFDKNYPARETVQVSALPKGAHVEISVIAN